MYELLMWLTGVCLSLTVIRSINKTVGDGIVIVLGILLFSFDEPLIYVTGFITLVCGIILLLNDSINVDSKFRHFGRLS